MCAHIIYKHPQPIYVITIVPIVPVVCIVCELGVIEALYKLTVNFIFILSVGISVKKKFTKKGFKHPTNLMCTYQPLRFSVIPVNRQVVLKKE